MELCIFERLWQKNKQITKIFTLRNFSLPLEGFGEANYKNMKKTIELSAKTLILFVLLSFTSVGFAQTGEKNFIDQNYIEVTGKAELEIVPDMIFVKIQLSDKDNKDKLPLPEIEKKMMTTLSDLGVNMEKDFSLVDFISNLKLSWFKSNVVLSKQYQVIVHDAKTLQKIFFEFQKLGISNVSIEKLDHSKIEQYRKDAKVNAIKAAKEKAELLAAALGQQIGKALYIQEADNQNPFLPSNVLTGNMAGVNVKKAVFNSSIDDAAVDIEFDKIKIESAILVRFELK